MEVLREHMRSSMEDEVFEDRGACDVHVEVKLPENDVTPIVLAEIETRDVLADDAPRGSFHYNLAQEDSRLDIT